MRQLPKGVWTKVRTLPSAEAENVRRLRVTDVFVVHTPLALSVLSVISARLLRRPVVAFVWDLHPESTRLVGSLRNPVLLAVYWTLERLVLLLATSIVIPSSDYGDAVARWEWKTKVVPLWPCDPIGDLPLPAPVPDGATLKVAFAGQINGIRDLGTGVEFLLRAWPGLVELHLFSKDPMPSTLATAAASNERLRVVEHGLLSPDELQEALRRLDAGWVSLDPEFELPAFPSKAMAYIAAGVPVLYNGPPLPGYRRWLTESGLGLCLDEEALPPGRIAALMAEFPGARGAYLRAQEAEWFGLEALL